MSQKVFPRVTRSRIISPTIPEMTTELLNPAARKRPSGPAGPRKGSKSGAEGLQVVQLLIRERFFRAG
jgi:hypothetical protein